MFRGERISRDPERIEPLLKKIQELWSMKPDMRFWQLLESVRFTGGMPPDTFYVEDNELNYALDESIRVAKVEHIPKLEDLVKEVKVIE